MKQMRLPIIAVLSAGLALSACSDYAQLGDPNDPNRKTKSGALIGAGVGAAVGAITAGNGDRTKGAVTGGIAGAIVGGAGGAILDRQAADLRRDLNNDQVKINNTGDSLIVTMPQDILFATDSAAVRSDLQRDLRVVAGNLQAYPNSTIQIIGHTDNTGDAGYNQTLSRQRASAVSDVLVNSGVSQGRIQAIGRGEDQPIANNLTPEGRAQNRRVEIVILPTSA